jgi:isopropylmalate/homocitrate/citramalate synthase
MTMVQILDATLREGEQTPGVYFDSHIKLAIADYLDRIGIDIIEAGHPLVSGEIHKAISQIAGHGYRAVIGAHSRSMQKDVDLALECGVDFIGIFYCVSSDRLHGVFKKDIGKAVEQIAKVISYAKEQKPDLIIRYTPEDTVRSDFGNVLAASVAAVQAGADIISVADTTGHMIPGSERSMFEYVTRLRTEMGLKNAFPKIAVHCHNDRGLALANALDALRGGVDIIDATVMGLGERAGLVDLAQLLVALSADFNVENKWDLKLLPVLYDLVSQHSGIPIPANFPITGANAFTHCAGVHTHAATIDPLHYQSLDPGLIGRKMEIALDHMSGISSVRFALEGIGEGEIGVDLAMMVLEKVKNIGQTGRTVEQSELPHIVQWCRSAKVAG